MTAILIDGLSVRVDDAAVESLTLHVAAGESVALVGRRQRLLTAVVRACGGLDAVAHGTIRIDGVDVGRANRSELQALRGRMGYVSVGGGLFANMTLLDNIALPLRYRGSSDTAAERRALELLDTAGLAALARTRAATISAELQKLAAYVRALAADPVVVLVEDPAAHLAPAGREVVEALHDGLRARGATVLVGDDDDELAARLADRVIDIDDAGRIPRTGATMMPARLGG